MGRKITTISFTTLAWDDYVHWSRHDRKILQRINLLIRDALRSPFEGLGKPEALRFELTGLWSRRIDGEHRMVYQVVDDSLVVFQCRYHY